MNQNKTARPIVPGLIVLAMSLILLLIGTTTILKIFRAKSWPIAQGMIVKSWIRSYEKEVKKDGYVDTVTKYYPEVYYEYVVDRKEYSNNKIYWGAKRSSHRFAEKYVKKYPIGKEIIVHYNPKKPGNSILESNYSFKSFLAFTGGVMMLVFAFVLLFKKVTQKAAEPSDNKFSFMNK